MPDVAIPLMPITDFVFRDMKKFGDRPALVNIGLFLLICLLICLFVLFLFCLLSMFFCAFRTVDGSVEGHQKLCFRFCFI